MTPDQRPLPPELPHIVILSEWDTTYGRSLGATFEAMASGRSVDEIIEQPDKRPPKIHSYHYLRGLDGQLPGDSGKIISRSRLKLLCQTRTRSQLRPRKG